MLAAFPAPLSAHAAAALARIGVEVRTGAPVTRVTPDAVWLGGEQIRARTVLWAAGVAASPLARSLGVPLDRAGRVLVEPDLSVPGHPAWLRHRRHVPAFHGPDGHRSRAWPRWRSSRGRRPRPTCGGASPASRPGPSATATRAAWPPSAAPPRSRWSAASSSTASPRGSPGSFVHIMFLIGFRNRFLVLFEWAWAYLSWQRGARLITDPLARPGPDFALPAVCPMLGNVSSRR